MAEFRPAHAEVEQAKGRVAIVGIEFGQQPDCMCVRGKQPDDRQRIALLATRGGSAVIQQLDALCVGDEWVHDRNSQVVKINAATVLHKRADEQKRICASAL